MGAAFRNRIGEVELVRRTPGSDDETHPRTVSRSALRAHCVTSSLPRVGARRVADLSR